MSQLDQLRLLDFLEHMLEAIAKIDNYTEDMIDLSFMEDVQVQDAVIRNIEIIGEASKNIMNRFPEFAAKHNDIPWEQIYYMRNRISHGYFSVDLTLIWRTIENDLPPLEQKIRQAYQLEQSAHKL